VGLVLYIFSSIGHYCISNPSIGGAHHYAHSTAGHYVEDVFMGLIFSILGIGFLALAAGALYSTIFLVYALGILSKNIIRSIIDSVNQTFDHIISKINKEDD
jgi:hypothetical protein